MNSDQQHTNPKQHSSPRNRWLVGIILLMIIGGYFWLNPPGVITQSVAEKFLSDSSKIFSLSEYSSITDEAAKALAQFMGDNLYLVGLTTLSPKSAQALAQFKGEYLNLDGLTTLSPETAKALAQFKGFLNLDGLTTLSPETAKALAQFKGLRLELNGLITISTLATEELSHTWGGFESSINLTNDAPALSQFKDRTLHLNGLKTISTDVAEAFQTSNATSLHLGGIQQLTSEAANALTKFQGDLIIDYASLPANIQEILQSSGKMD